MPDLAEVKTLIEEDRKNTEALRDEVKKLSSKDYVDRDAFSKLEALVEETSKKRAEKEAEYLKELEETKKIAEEANLKAGRRGAGSEVETDADHIAHKDAFMAHIRGRNDQVSAKECKALEKKLGSSTGTGPGVGVPSQLATEINKQAADLSVMQTLVKTVTVGTSDYREIVDPDGFGYGWVGPGDTRAETSETSPFEVTPDAGTVYAYPKLQEEQLDDVFFDIPAWLLDHASISFANGIDAAVIDGDGDDKPTGLLDTAPESAADGSRTDGSTFQFIASGAASDLTDAAKLYTLIYTLRSDFRQRASFIMNSATMGKIRAMKDSNGRFLWSDSLAVGQPATLAGYTVNAAEKMPDYAANALPIGFGDWRNAYTLVTRHELRLTPDNITEPGFYKWHMRRRVAGCPTNGYAAKFLKLAA